MPLTASAGELLRRVIYHSAGLHILVIGDVMLDAYISGDVLRISPEAPVPVVNVAERRYMSGGAANVAANIGAMGCAVSLGGVTGIDEAGIRLRREFERIGIAMQALIEDPARPTTIKTRVMARAQQIVRFDHEDTSPVCGLVTDQLRSSCEKLLPSVHACVISDYAKGVLTDPFCRWLIDECARQSKPVVVDPKSRDLARYRGATVITPNHKEVAASAGELIESEEDLVRSADVLLARIAPSALLVTRGADGMSLFEPGRGVEHMPSHVNEVADVTGAGDTVAALLAVALAAGFGLSDAAAVANIAAGLAVKHVGTWAVEREELLDEAETLERLRSAAV